MNRPESKITANHNRHVSHFWQWLVVSLLLLSLYGCGNSVSNGQDPNGGGSNFPSGVVLTADQDLFDRQVRTPILRQHCSGCHEPGGNGNGQFAHQTDIPLAYSEAQRFVDPNDIPNSRLITKVQGGGNQGPHNCWDTNNDTVPDCPESVALLTSALTNWLSTPAPVAEAEQEANQSTEAVTQETSLNDLVAQLNPVNPPPVPVAEQIVLGVTPGADEAGYNTHVYGPIVSQYCQECHSENAVQAQRQQPYFADTDLTVAFNAVVDNRKIDINTPANSRIYKRLSQDSHNCWSDCANDAAAMLLAIENWKNAIVNDPSYSAPTVDGEGTTPYSSGLELGQGQIISGGDRYRRNLVALWEFKEGATDPAATVVTDTSGVSPQLNLRLEGELPTDADDESYALAWVGGYGIEFNGGRLRAESTEASQKIYDLIAPRNAYTLEAWVVPDNVAQEGPAVIATYSAGNSNRNFTMGQTLYSYEFLNRNTASGLDAGATANGQPTLITDPDDEDLQATQQHVVMTYDPTNGRQVYVNGQLTSAPGDSDDDTILGGNLNNWDDGYLFVMGAETDGSTNPWRGKVRLFAIYHTALSPDQVTQNFEAGVGQKFNLLFKVGHLDNNGADVLPEESYIWFEAAEFDSYAYLFAKPRFVVTGNTSGLSAFSATIRGMRIGVNGIEAPVGQVFLNMNKTVDMSFGDTDPKYVELIDSALTRVDGQDVMVPVSATGTVISKINGPNPPPGTSADQFYLTFEQLGDQFDTRTPSVSSGVIAYNYEAPEAGLADNTYKTGIKLFEEINATMSVLTNVDVTNSTVRNIYLEIQQALPGNVAMEAFLASNQISIAKLALGYCGELVDNSGSTYFPGFPFNEPVATAFDTTGEQDIIVNELYDNMIIQDVASQPTRTELRDILFATGTGLFDQMASNCSTDPNCTPDANRTRAVVKSMCVSVLSSAAVTVQ